MVKIDEDCDLRDLAEVKESLHPLLGPVQPFLACRQGSSIHVLGIVREEHTQWKPFGRGCGKAVPGSLVISVLPQQENRACRDPLIGDTAAQR